VLFGILSCSKAENVLLHAKCMIYGESQDNLHEVEMAIITAAQLKAARGLIGLSQTQVAEAAKVGRATIADFEAGKRQPYNQTLEDLRAALEANGVEFINGGQPGVRVRESFVKVIGKGPRLRPFRVGDQVKFRPGKERDHSRIGQIGVVSKVIQMGLVPFIVVRFGDCEMPGCMPPEFEFAPD
jgi:transcriptional regulator with XRE-family HTH domain